MNWEARARIDGLERVQVRCPVCRDWRWDAAKTVRKRIREGSYTGRCLRHRRRPRVDNPSHPDVDWITLRSTGGPATVMVRCEECDLWRWDLAKSVRRRIVAGTYTGRCLKHRTRPAVANPPHPEVDWATAGNVDGSYRVQVHCPHCDSWRWDVARSVRKRIRDGTFSGSCRKHWHRRDVSNPPHPNVDWSTAAHLEGEMRVKVRCSECADWRWDSAKSVRRRIRRGQFTGRCRQHSRRGAAASKLPAAVA